MEVFFVVVVSRNCENKIGVEGGGREKRRT